MTTQNKTVTAAGNAPQEKGNDLFVVLHELHETQAQRDELWRACLELLREFVPSRDRFKYDSQGRAYDAATRAIARAEEGRGGG